MLKRDLYLKKLEMYTGRDVVKIITGVRRCGKTTLIRQFIEELRENGIQEENIIYLNFEGMIYTYLTRTESLREMLSEFIRQANGRCYIFLDEIQNVENWAQVAAELMNLFDCELFVTASNSSVFQPDFASILGYRYVKIDVYPFNFSEFLEITAGEEGHHEEEDVVMRTKDELFREYLERGSMPGVYALKDAGARKDYLSNLYSAILLKDVVQCNKLRDISHIDKIMEYILNHIGETFSPKAIRDYVKQQGVTISVDTVYSFLDALTGAFLLHKVPRYDIKADRELETQEKYYICDLAMRNAVMGDEGVPEEAMLESSLLMELLVRGFTVYVGKQGAAQIDFMAVKGEDRTYLNCCGSIEEKEAVKREFGPLTRIRDNYFKMVLTMDPETKVNKGGIINYPLVSFLAQG